MSHSFGSFKKKEEKKVLDCLTPRRARASYPHEKITPAAIIFKSAFVFHEIGQPLQELLASPLSDRGSDRVFVHLRRAPAARSAPSKKKKKSESKNADIWRIRLVISQPDTS